MRLYQSFNPNINIFKLLYEKRNIEKIRILNETYFWEVLAFNLCRILDRVYTSLIHYFMEAAGYKTGVYSQQERLYLKNLVKKHGKNWRLISNLMKRSPNHLSKIYHLTVKNSINEGRWTKYEKEKLLYISKKLMQYNQHHSLPLYQISWRTVSDFVQSRSANSCCRFASSNKVLLHSLLVQNQFTLLLKETLVLYLYFSEVQSRKEIDIKELILLYDGKFTEKELKEELNKFIPVLTNDILQEIIKAEFKNAIQESKTLFKRINFENVILCMKKTRTVPWMKAKFYLLVKENISEYNNKSAEEIITILHEEYCYKKSFENNEDTSEQETCILDSNEISINSEIIKATIPSIDLISDDEDESELVDLTLIADGDDDVTNDFDNVADDNDDVTNDFGDVTDDNYDLYNIIDVMIID